MTYLLGLIKNMIVKKNWEFGRSVLMKYLYTTRLGAPTSKLRPFRPALGLLDNVLRALLALRSCDPRNSRRLV